MIDLSDDDDDKDCQPLPPSEDGRLTPTIFEVPPDQGPKTPPPRPEDTVDMDMGSENEAEVQFFKEQRSQSQAWPEASKVQPVPGLPPGRDPAPLTVPQNAGQVSHEPAFPGFLQSVIDSSRQERKRKLVIQVRKDLMAKKPKPEDKPEIEVIDIATEESEADDEEDEESLLR